jgi:hypothetical protein
MREFVQPLLSDRDFQEAMVPFEVIKSLFQVAPKNDQFVVGETRGKIQMEMLLACG